MSDTIERQVKEYLEWIIEESFEPTRELPDFTTNRKLKIKITEGMKKPRSIVIDDLSDYV